MQLSATTQQLLRLLADGQFHSGTQLAASCNISRSSVWNQLQNLSELGLHVVAVTGRGYRLPQQLQLLDEAEIVGQLSPVACDLLGGIDIRTVIDSTNSRLLEAAMQGAPSGSVCLAEFQSAGKGRRGRRWVSPFGGNIYLSLLWRYQAGPGALAGLSLAVGVAVIRVLRQLGIADALLKWPNDIYWHGRKLGGILIEVSGESGGPCHAVIGLGLNVCLSDQEARSIDQAWVDLQRISAGQTPERNRLTALLLNQLLPMAAGFEQATLSSYLSEWRQYDCLLDQPARLSFGEHELVGIVRGVDDQGLLLLEVDGQQRSFASGEVSLRLT